MMEDETFKNEVLALNSTYDASEITFDVLLEDTTEENQAAYEAVTDRVFNQALLDFETIKNDSAYHDTSDSILAGLGQLIQPLFTPLGFGSNLDRQNGWVFGVSAVTGLIAKENVISTFAVLAQCTSNQTADTLDGFKTLYFTMTDEEGVNASIQMIQNAGVGNQWPILIAFIVFNMTTIPCFAAVATAKAELPKKKLGRTLLFWLITSYIASMICFLVLSWWWTSLIIAALFVASGFGIHYYNRYRDQKGV